MKAAGKVGQAPRHSSVEDILVGSKLLSQLCMQAREAWRTVYKGSGRQGREQRGMQRKGNWSCFPRELLHHLVTLC